MYNKIVLLLSLVVCSTSLFGQTIFEDEHKNYGLKDARGTVIIEPVFHSAYFTRDSLITVSIDDKWGVIDTTGTTIIPIGYDRVDEFSEGLAAIRLGEKWGYVDRQGAVVIPIIYESAYSFTEGLAPVELNNKCGFINKDNEVVIPFKFDGANSFHNGRSWGHVDDQWGYINKEGEFSADHSDTILFSCFFGLPLALLVLLVVYTIKNIKQTTVRQRTAMVVNAITLFSWVLVLLAIPGGTGMGALVIVLGVAVAFTVHLAFSLAFTCPVAHCLFFVILSALALLGQMYWIVCLV